MNEEERKEWEKDLAEIRQILKESSDAKEKRSEDLWNSLTKEQQLDVFCAVVRRIYQGEIIDQGSYRHVLYSVFGFGLESYAQAQLAGYLTIHNSICDGTSENSIEDDE